MLLLATHLVHKGDLLLQNDDRLVVKSVKLLVRANEERERDLTAHKPYEHMDTIRLTRIEIPVDLFMSQSHCNFRERLHDKYWYIICRVNDNNDMRTILDKKQRALRPVVGHNDGQ